jgi:RNA polymerase sigma factor (TIGR02999 family)
MNDRFADCAAQRIAPEIGRILQARSDILGHMGDVTNILCRLDAGDPSASGELLPLIYEELRQLAAAKLAKEKPGQTLQATALVHEAYLRLVGPNVGAHWNGRAHFFGAAAEAMRRILVESARRKGRSKRGGQWRRHDLSIAEPVMPAME